jgi:hypothetical protein
MKTLAGLAALLFVVVGCGKAPAPKLISTSISSDFVCMSPDMRHGTLIIDGLTACTYRPAVKRLDLVIERRSTELADDYVQINVANFTGVKSYTTTASDSETADTFVQAFGTATDGMLQSGASTTLDTCTGPCTINVTAAGVVAAGQGGTGTLSVEVDCPRLVAQGPTCYTCSYSPSLWKFDVKDCARDD